jgi:hypothetical protein
LVGCEKSRGNDGNGNNHRSYNYSLRNGHFSGRPFGCLSFFVFFSTGLCGLGGVLKATRKAAVARRAVSSALNSSGIFAMIQPSSNLLDPRKIFDHAWKFQWTEEYMRHKDRATTKEHVDISGDPCLVLSALASELYTPIHR